MYSNFDFDGDFLEHSDGNDFTGESTDTNGMENITGSSDTYSPDGDISFGASVWALESASLLHSLGDILPLPMVEKICDAFGDYLSGAGQPGMDVIRDSVQDTCNFFKVELPNVFHEPGELGVQWDGFTSANGDNWIGGDPAVLNDYSDCYGKDFVSCTFAHETGHHFIDRIGWSEHISRRGNEAASDYMAGLYAGSRGLEPEGFATFLREEGNTGMISDYPLGEEREELFRRGYEEAQAYPFRDFQSVVDDMGFNLHGKISDIQKQYG